jgi:hypothetical protein
MLLQSLLCNRKRYKNKHPQESMNFTSSPGKNSSIIIYIWHINSVQNQFLHHEKWSPKVPIPITFFLIDTGGFNRVSKHFHLSTCPSSRAQVRRAGAKGNK